MQEVVQFYCDRCSKHISECVCESRTPEEDLLTFSFLENNVEHEISRGDALRLRAKGFAMFTEVLNKHKWQENVGAANVLKSFVNEALKRAPLYFWVTPASSSGKYHTAETQGVFGLVKHTIVVMYYAEELARTFGLTEGETDELLVAATIHDLCKYGQDYDPRYFSVHECLPAVFLGYKGHNIMKMLSPDTQNRIIQMIAHHNGSIATGEWTTFREPPRTPAEQVLHLADYVASRKEIKHASFEGLEL